MNEKLIERIGNAAEIDIRTQRGRVLAMLFVVHENIHLVAKKCGCSDNGKPYSNCPDCKGHGIVPVGGLNGKIKTL